MRTVTFNANGGTPTPASQQVQNGRALGTLPANPRRDNHTFVGWFNTPATTGGTQFTAHSPAITANTTLWARWRINNAVINSPTQNQQVPHGNVQVNWNAFQEFRYHVSVYDVTFDGAQTRFNVLPRREVPAGNFEMVGGRLHGFYTIPAHRLVVGRRYEIVLESNIRTGANALSATNHRNFNVVAPNYYNMSRQALAQEILNRHHNVSASGRRILLRCPFYDLNSTNRRSSLANIQDTAQGRMARTRLGYVNLSPNLLIAILRTNDQFGNIVVNTIAGGTHLGDVNIEEHINGRAVDLSIRQYWVNQVGGSILIPRDTLNYLQFRGHITQQNRNQDIHPGVAGPNYTGGDFHFHISIW